MSQTSSFSLPIGPVHVAREYLAEVAPYFLREAHF